MKQICDSNYLRDPELADYLDATRSNQIILADVTLIEMHKRNALLTATRSTEQLLNRSGQVIVLKHFTRIYSRSLNSAARVREIFDMRQSRGFGEYCELLRAAPGIDEAERLILERQRQAAQEIAFIARDCAHIQPIFKKINARFSPAELTELRKRIPYGPTTQKKLVELIYDMSRGLFVAVGVARESLPRTKKHAINFFIFRYAMCLVLYYTRWVHFGQQQRSEDILVNDMVDMHLAAIATYFGGILSKDERLLGVHQEARFLLRTAGAYVG